MDFVNRSLPNELNILPERQPREHPRFARGEREIPVRIKLDADALCIRLLLHKGVHPLISVLEEIPARDEPPLAFIGILREAKIGFGGG